MEIFKASVYNPVFGNTWISELSGFNNTCIGQKISLKPGKIWVSFDWGARSGMNLDGEGMDLRLNGKVFKRFKAADFKVNKEAFELPLPQVQNESLIQFCGAGVNDSQGLMVDNVRLSNFDQCATSKTFQY